MLGVLRPRYRSAFFICGLLIFWFAASVTDAQQPAAQLKQVSYENAFKRGNSMPRWQENYLVSWRSDTSPSDTSDNIVLYDRAGKAAGRARVWLDGASLVRIEDVALRSDGNVAAVGWAMSASGDIAAFVADLSTKTGSGRVVRTSPFEGQAVGFAPDGTIWVLGLQVGLGQKISSAPDHFMVQHYGSDDTLQGEHLLRSMFQCELAFPVNGIPRIVATSDRVGLFAPSCRRWIEINPSSGELIGSWAWPAGTTSSNGVETAGIRSIVLTETNQLYGWRNSKGESLLRFDRSSGQWVAVQLDPTQMAEAPFWSLFGADGDMLVYHTRGKKLAWFKP